MAASTRHSLPLLLPAASAAYARTAADSWAWSETAARTVDLRVHTMLTLPFTLPDILGGTGDVWAWSDTATRGTVIHGGLIRNAGDTWAWTDTASRVTTTTRTRTASDTWAWSETAATPTGGVGLTITHDTYTVAATGGPTTTSTANQVTVAQISDTSPIPA